MDTFTETQDKIIEEQRATFIASLGHDLKNPTIAQIRALELFLKGNFGTLQPVQREVLEMVLDSCKYMNAMLSSLLSTYRNEKGVVKLNSEPVSISEIAAECAEEMIYLAKDKGINIDIINTADKPEVYGDKVQLKRVVMNLLSNGIKYAFRDTCMKIRVYNEENYTCFCFENKSPYIPINRRNKIFARYVSYASAHNEFGVGLGLYASKKIVEAHNGIIYVKSYENNQTIFGFKIPNDAQYRDMERIVIF